MAVRTRNQVIAFRVTLAEARKIREKVRRSGLSQQEYLLRAALEQQILVIHELKPILTELRAWGRNLNQLTVLAHTGHIQTVYLKELTEALGRRHYPPAGQVGTACGQRRNRRNDPALSWRSKSTGQGAGKEDCHGAQGGRSRGRTENEPNDFPPALRKSQVLGGIFNRTLQKMIRINKEKLLLGPPSNIAGLKTIIECFHGS